MEESMSREVIKDDKDSLLPSIVRNSTALETDTNKIEKVNLKYKRGKSSKRKKNQDNDDN